MTIEALRRLQDHYLQQIFIRPRSTDGRQTQFQPEDLSKPQSFSLVTGEPITFEGTSDSGDVSEAILNAANVALEANPTFVKWELAKVRGERGGIIGAKKVTVIIRVLDHDAPNADRSSADDVLRRDIKEVEGTEQAEPAPAALRILTIPAASFSNSFENSNQAPGRIHFFPSPGTFTADRSTGAYAKEGFALEKSGLKIVNIRLHARDNSSGNVLVQAYGFDKGTTNKTEIATFFSSGSSLAVRTFDFSLSHTYQASRYHTVTIHVPDGNCDVYGIEIWYQD